jgi:membrane associated rhomboid family serine protease
MAQLVGQRCVRCAKVIQTILDGDFCIQCGRAIHHLCKLPDSQSNTQKHCSVCGGDPSLSFAPDFGLGKALRQTTHRNLGPGDVSPSISSDSGVSPQREKNATSPEFQRTLASQTPRVYVTPVLVGLNMLVFIIMAASGVSPFDPKVLDVLRWGADFGPQTTSGQWWRLLTCIFIHFGIIHILFNMWVLAVAGPLVERMVGHIGFLVLYLVGGLCGSIASLLWNPLVVSAGASGAIFGIYGALLGLLLRQHHSIPPKGFAQLRSSGLGFLFYNLIYGMMQAHVDSAAHIGGLAGGFLGGIVLSQPSISATAARRPGRTAMLTGVGIILVVVGMIGVSAWHPDLANVEFDFGSKVQHGDIEVFYKDGATKTEADRLGAYLVKAWGVFPKGRRTVQLKKTSDGYLFRMAVMKEFQKDPKTLKQLEFDGAMISRDVFDGAAVEVHACDEHLKTLMKMPPRPDVRYGVVDGNAEVFFAADVDKSDAQRLARHLSNLFKDAPAMASSKEAQLVSFKLAQRGQIREVHMVINQEVLKDPAVIADLREVRKDIADNVFKGATVEMHLCDELLKVVRVLEP